MIRSAVGTIKYEQSAVNWILAKQEVSSIITGVQKPEKIEDNLGTTRWRLKIRGDKHTRPNSGNAPLDYQNLMMNPNVQR